MKIGIFPYKFVQRAVQLGNISVSSETTFSGILKGFSVILGLAVLTKFILIIKTFVAYLTKNILKGQKGTCYLYLSREILARQAGNIVHSWKNRWLISIFLFSSGNIISSSNSAFPIDCNGILIQYWLFELNDSGF